MSSPDLRDLIRPLKAEPPARPADPPFVSRVLPAFEARERLEATLQPFLQALQDEIPALRLARHFYDGAWLQCLSAMRPSGHGGERSRGGRRALQAYSRLDFAIDVDLARQELQLTCRMTIYDHDYDTTGHTVAIDVVQAADAVEGADTLQAADAAAADDPALQAFLENTLVLFAGRFFAAERRARRARSA